jgi:hypothetical protein
LTTLRLFVVTSNPAHEVPEDSIERSEPNPVRGGPTSPQVPCGVALPWTFSSDRRRQMGQERESAAAEVERLTRLRDAAEKGSAEHRELNHRLMKARRRLYEVESRSGGRR